MSIASITTFGFGNFSIHKAVVLGYDTGSIPPPVQQAFQPGSKGDDFFEARKRRLEEELIMLMIN